MKKLKVVLALSLACGAPVIAAAGCSVTDLDHVKIESSLEGLMSIQRNIQARFNGSKSDDLSVSFAMRLTELMVTHSVDHGLYMRPYWSLYVHQGASDDIREMIDQITDATVLNARQIASRQAVFSLTWLR